MPLTLKVAIGLLWIQFLALLGLLAIYVWLLVQEPSVLGYYVGFFLLIFTLAWFFILLALGRGSAAARGAIIALELLVLAPAYYMITGDRPVLGVALGAVALAVIGLLVAPPTNRALGSTPTGTR